MSRPGLAANGPQREVFVNSATAGGYSSHGGCYQQAERAPVLPRGFFFGVTWGTGAPPPPGKGEGQVHSHVWASGTGESWG